MSLELDQSSCLSILETPAQEYGSRVLQELAGAGLQQQPADPRFSQANIAQVVAMALDNDYLNTKHALVAMTRAFKRFIEYSSKYDTYLMGQIDKREFDSAMKDFATYPTPDEGALSQWIELVLRESSLRLYSDEIATMFAVSETQVDRILDGLTRRGVLMCDDENQAT